jgi:hypothetical protein
MKPFLNLEAYASSTRKIISKCQKISEKTLARIVGITRVHGKFRKKITIFFDTCEKDKKCLGKRFFYTSKFIFFAHKTKILVFHETVLWRIISGCMC